MSHRKRKYRQRSDTHSNQYDLAQASSSSTSTRPPDHSLFIIAHEADIIRGPQAARSADLLEVGINIDGQGGSRIGEGLIKWESSSSSKRDAEEAARDMWVDRYVISWRAYSYCLFCGVLYIETDTRCLRSALPTCCLMVRLTNSRIFFPPRF